MKLTLAFSPCPNDTFIFDALIHKRIDTLGYTFEVVLADVEELNKSAFASQHDISKLSFHAYAYASANYQLLHSGSALGSGCGPLLVCNTKHIGATADTLKVAIPGVYTTANFLLGLAYPKLSNKTALLFSDIEDAVASGAFDAGLIIHENRFTYQEKGLHLVQDLGSFWEQYANAPIPLGAIAIRRSLPNAVKKDMDKLIRESVEYAFANPDDSMPYTKLHAQSMKPEVMQQHIALYVNKYSIDLGVEGEKSVQLLYHTALQNNIVPPLTEPLFVAH